MTLNRRGLCVCVRFACCEWKRWHAFSKPNTDYSKWYFCYHLIPCHVRRHTTFTTHFHCMHTRASTVRTLDGEDDATKLVPIRIAWHLFFFFSFVRHEMTRNDKCDKTETHHNNYSVRFSFADDDDNNKQTPNICFKRFQCSAKKENNAIPFLLRFKHFSMAFVAVAALFFRKQSDREWDRDTEPSSIEVENIRNGFEWCRRARAQSTRNEIQNCCDVRQCIECAKYHVTFCSLQSVQCNEKKATFPEPCTLDAMEIIIIICAARHYLCQGQFMWTKNTKNKDREK